MLLHGIFPPITTPFYPDGNVYYKKLEANVERYSRTPIGGIVVLGSTGEAIMLSMVGGSRAFPVNPIDGTTFLFEPVQPLAATIVKEFGGQSGGPVASTIYAIAAVLLFSAALLSFTAWAVKQRLKRYGIGA